MTAASHGLSHDRGRPPPTESPDVRYARHPVRWGRSAFGVLILLIIALLVHFLVASKRLEWNVVGQYLFSAEVLKGLATTLIIAVVAQAIGTALGILFAAMRLSSLWLARAVGTAYVTVLRSVPVLVQLVFWFNIAYLLPKISIGVPFGPTFASWQTNSVVTAAVAAILGLSLCQGAYMTEIIRGGILSVDAGQRDAARALGYSPAQTFFRVVLPQAIRVSIPPAGSQFITVIHGTSLVSVLAVGDLLFSVESVYQQTYQVVPLLLVAVIWYLIVVIVFTVLQQRLEKRLSQGHMRVARSGIFARRHERRSGT
jgi:polar amino acid transport system permease protein